MFIEKPCFQKQLNRCVKINDRVFGLVFEIVNCARQKIDRVVSKADHPFCLGGECQELTLNN